MSPTPAFPNDRLHVEPWNDPLVNRLGHDPRSTYAEQYGLEILGPSACWLLRRLADGLDAEPTGFDLDLHNTAASIGIRLNGGRHAPFLPTLGRLCQFRMARQADPTTLEVRRHLPSLTLSQADRFPTEPRPPPIPHEGHPPRPRGRGHPSCTPPGPPRSFTSVRA